MAFSKMTLTTEGKHLFAKAQQGKPLHISKVALGDGILGSSGSLVHRSALVSQKLAIPIDAVLLVDNASAATVLAYFTNENLAEAFYFRELGIFAKDPDTQEEKLYLYDNAGTDGELIQDKNGVPVRERLKFMIAASDVASITFDASGNPVSLTMEDIDDAVATPYTLWSSKKISDQLALLPSLPDIQNKAPLDSPSFTGTPTAPTPVLGDSSTKIATTKFINDALASFVGSAPEALDTLTELAAALGNDPNFATTIAASIGAKADKSYVDGRLLKTDTPVTIAVASWIGSGAPYTYTMAIANANANTTIFVNPTNTLANVTAIGKSVILAEANGSNLVFKALKAKPTVAISFNLVREG